MREVALVAGEAVHELGLLDPEIEIIGVGSHLAEVKLQGMKDSDALKVGVK